MKKLKFNSPLIARVDLLHYFIAGYSNEYILSYVYKVNFKLIIKKNVYDSNYNITS